MRTPQEYPRKRSNVQVTCYHYGAQKNLITFRGFDVRGTRYHSKHYHEYLLVLAKFLPWPNVVHESVPFPVHGRRRGLLVR